MRSVPTFLKGAFRGALVLAMDEALAGLAVLDEPRQERAWKLFMLLPRLLLHRPSRGGLVKKSKLRERFAQFASGQWDSLLEESVKGAEEGSDLARRKRRREQDELVKRAARAEKLVHLGELSAARQALEGEAVAPGTLRTQAALMDPSRRLPVPREPLPEDLNLFEPEEPFELDFDRFARNIRCAGRGAAGGPSGMTAEHLRPLLENDRDIAKLCDFASIMARGEVPDRIEPAVRLGRITALQKPDGGVRGIVVSDFLRRAVARTMAQQVSKEVEDATAPFQYALKTKSGCECFAHLAGTHGIQSKMHHHVCRWCRRF